MWVDVSVVDDKVVIGFDHTDTVSGRVETFASCHISIEHARECRDKLDCAIAVASGNKLAADKKEYERLLKEHEKTAARLEELSAKLKYYKAKEGSVDRKV